MANQIEARRLIINAAKANYKPGLKQAGEEAMRRYVVDAKRIPLSEYNRIWAAAVRCSFAQVVR